MKLEDRPSPLTDAIQSQMCKAWQEADYPDPQVGDAAYFTNQHLEEALTEMRRLERKLAHAVEALERLARLGNGERPGNSVSNSIAQQALHDIEAAGKRKD